MKIKRVKILSPFRGLTKGYEVNFNPSSENEGLLEPVCFVGLNGSGKSNVLEVIAEIFYYLEKYHKADKKSLSAFKTEFGFEIEYYLPKISFDMARVPWDELTLTWSELDQAPCFRIIKQTGEYPVISALFGKKEIVFKNKDNNRNEAVLPARVIAYSSGMNELISNPFIKIDVQYLDEFEEKSGESAFSGLEMNRLFYMGYESNKLIAISNFLFDEQDFDRSEYATRHVSASDFGGINLKPLRDELRIKDLKSFSIKIKLRNGKNYPVHLPSELFLAIEDLKKCATFCDEYPQKTGRGEYNIYDMHFWVNKEIKAAFRYYFKTAFNLYLQLYYLRLLNIYLLTRGLRNKVINAGIKTNIADMIPRNEEEKLIFSVNDIAFEKKNVKEKVYYKQLSDGEHQLLQVLGTILLMDKPGTLFILDEPETHFNPEWRSKFVNLLNSCLKNKSREQDIIITSHSPFIVSDCKSNKVLIFSINKKGKVLPPTHPQINTFGTSVGILTEEIFGKKETISELSNNEIERIKKFPLDSLEDIQKAKNESKKLGESVEKVLLFRELIIRENELKKNA